MKKLKSTFKNVKEELLLTRLKGANQSLTVDEENLLKKADEHLSKLSIEIENLSGKYAIEYSGELYDWKTSTFYESEPSTECLILNGDHVIFP